VENYVALIVGCMPAFAKFFKIKVASSTLYKRMQSRFTSHTGGSSPKVSYPSTIGSGGKKPNQKKPEIQEVTRINFPPGCDYDDLSDMVFLTQMPASAEALSTPAKLSQEQSSIRTKEVDQQLDTHSVV
jgi:hypothetical protein